MEELRQLAPRLCAALFDDGGSIEHARAHAIAAPFVVAPHAHEALVQVDWIVNCRGSVTIDRRAVSLNGGSALAVVGAGRRHAMSLEAAADGARVYHVRLALPLRWRKVLRGTSRVMAGLPANPTTEAAFTDVWRLTVGGDRRPLLRKARLAEAIARWPGVSGDGDGPAMSTGGTAATGLDRDLDAALQLMERLPAAADRPPTLGELADAAGLSVRHFTRRFRDAFGIPPMEFLDRKRLALAQQMLAYESAAVGDVADRMGFSSAAVFSRWFTNLADETPSAYRARPHAL